MNRPIIIVDPLSAGIELAPAFKKRGVPAIAITLPNAGWKGYGSALQSSDFDEIIPNQPNLIERLRQYNPIGILPGTEESVAIAEQLTGVLLPHYANDPKKSSHRLHKALMQTALKEAGVPSILTINTASENAVDAWITENNLRNTPLIIKPPVSAGSDKVFHIPANADWKSAFYCVLSEPSTVNGKMSETVVVQEQVSGTEFAVGTVSAHGKHYLAHLIKYNKGMTGTRETVYDHVEFVPYDETIYKTVFEYTQRALDALGIRWGASHNEIMLTPKGPRLIELGARMCGGPIVRAARAASGSSQADKLVEIFVDGDVTTRDYQLHQTVMPVFLRSLCSGIVKNAEVFDAIHALPTLLNPFIWYKNGEWVPKTVDYLTSLGIVVLAGDRDAIFSDYRKIRDMETRLIVK